MDASLVSIIIPVYNVKEYLDSCISSVFSQSYNNLEIILVDDGSTDGSGALCDEYASVDNRVVVIHKENGGLSDARNKGMDVMRGDYVFFLDSDDELDKDCIKVLLDSIIENDASIAIGDYLRIDEKGDLYDSDDLTSPEAFVLSGYDAYCYDYGKKSIDNVVAWGKLYSKQIIREIRYPVGKLHEDEYVTYKLLSNSERVCFVNKCVYKYRIRSGSIMNVSISIKNLEVADALIERIEYFEKNNQMKAKRKSIEYLYSCIATWAENCNGNSEVVEMINLLYKKISEEYGKKIGFRLKFGIFRRILLMNIKNCV